MRKLIFGLGIAAAGFIMPTASADDYCCPLQYDPCCGLEFNGLYVGGNIGVVSHTAHRHDFDGFLTDNSGWTVTDTDFTAGVQVGYDIQCCNKVFGIVADWNWTNNDRREHDNPSAVGDDNFFHNEHNWFTTIRGRAGLAVCDALVYITAGAAVSRFETRWRDAPDEFRFRNTKWGWVGGFGTEFALWCNWSVGAEILYIHYDQHNETGTVGTTNFVFGHSDHVWVGRVLLNYRFGDLCGCW